MDYLKEYVAPSVYDELINILSLDIQSALFREKENVLKVINYLKSIKVQSFDDLFKMRIDLLFENVDSLKNKISKLDVSFISFIIQNDVGNLINLGI